VVVDTKKRVHPSKLKSSEENDPPPWTKTRNWKKQLKSRLLCDVRARIQR